MTTKTFFFLVFLCFFKLSLSQTYSGKVIDSKTNEPLEGVSIYFDGTTIGVTTNTNGAYSITVDGPLKPKLVISYIGYEKLILSFKSLENNPVFKLKPQDTFLEEVVLFDDWSRQKKLDLFRYQFLGFGKDALKCEIKNEDDLILNYNKTEDKLYASSNTPLIIENKALGYIIHYDLVDFELTFGTSDSGFRNPLSLFYSGTSRFENIDKKKIKSKYEKARKMSYYGSFLHFMRVLSKRQLTEQEYEVFVKAPADDSDLYFKTTPESVFKIIKYGNDGYNAFILNKHKVVIRYKTILQSSITILDEDKQFYIDNFGVHTPVDKLIFGGEFGNQRVSNMLPVNYFPN